MEFDDLNIGMRVRIIDWMDESYYRPEHWNVDGYMDDWCGEEVTISHTVGYGSVYIEEDDGDWRWQPEDFEDVMLLSADNPNVKFIGRKKEGLLNRLRKKIAPKKTDATT